MSDKMLLKLDISHEELGSGRFFLRGEVDGVEERFFFDTGAAAQTLKKRKEYDSYKAVATKKLAGFGGKPIEEDVIKIKNVRFGEKSISGVDFIRLSNSASESTLNLNFFDAQTMFFNSSRKELVFNDNLSCDSYFPFVYKDGKRISFVGGMGDKSLQLIWDTGAGLTTINENVIKENPENFVVKQKIQVGDTVGSGKEMLIYNVKKMMIAGKEFNDVTALVTNFDFIEGKLGYKVDVILGFNLIISDSWFFDFKDLKFSIGCSK